GVGRGLGVALGVAVGVAVVVGAGLGVGVGVTVGVGVGVTVGVGVSIGVVGDVGEGLGEPPPIAARISNRPHPYTLLGGPASPQSVEEIKWAALFNAARLASIWFFRSGIADHSSAMAPDTCGVAWEVPTRCV